MSITALAAGAALLAGSLTGAALPADRASVAAQQQCSGEPDPNRSDFNGDGNADAVVGDPFQTVDGDADAGSITVMYGGGDGRVGEGRRVRITQDTPGVPGAVEPGDVFGFQLEPVNVDGDGCTDVVVGIPNEDLGGVANAGALTILYGSPEGLGAERSLWIDQDTESVPGGREDGDQFGFRVTAAPAKGPDAATVVAGTPYEDVGSIDDAGAAIAMWFTGSGKVAAGRWFDQDTPGLPGSPEARDLFGSDVELAEVSGSSGRWDLIVGLPWEDIGSAGNAGAITMVEDIAEARTSYPAGWWTQDAEGVGGSVEADDRFGADPEWTPTPEGGYVVAGVPGEDLRGARNGGMVQVFQTSGDGLNPQRTLHQDRPGASGGVEDFDYFGSDLDAAERPMTGGHAQVIVGIPFEDLAGARNAGAVQVISLDAQGIEDRWIAQTVSGVPGSPDTNDRVGSALGVAGDEDERVMLIGAPREDGRGMVHVVPFEGDGGRLWYPGSGGVPGGTTRFGSSVAGHD